MSIHIGGIDIAKQSLDNEFFIALADEYLDWLIEHNKLKKPSEEELQKMRENVVEKLQKKYPEAGITFVKK